MRTCSSTMYFDWKLPAAANELIIYIHMCHCGYVFLWSALSQISIDGIGFIFSLTDTSCGFVQTGGDSATSDLLPEDNKWNIFQYSLLFCSTGKQGLGMLLSVRLSCSSLHCNTISQSVWVDAIKFCHSFMNTFSVITLSQKTCIR